MAHGDAGVRGSRPSAGRVAATIKSSAGDRRLERRPTLAGLDSRCHRQGCSNRHYMHPSLVLAKVEFYPELVDKAPVLVPGCQESSASGREQVPRLASHLARRLRTFIQQKQVRNRRQPAATAQLVIARYQVICAVARTRIYGLATLDLRRRAPTWLHQLATLVRNPLKPRGVAA